MITPARVRERLNERPFRPFRLHLSDGSHHDVPHPEFAWVAGTRLFIGRPRGNGTRDEWSDWSVKELSILHLTQIDDLPRARRKK
ncbi:MAG TPA: hypothetical protein VG095_04440 [Chthoniobacterales bacterium]|nr:hypothetical protein [Chthoniobacterales bacterium]